MNTMRIQLLPLALLTLQACTTTSAPSMIDGAREVEFSQLIEDKARFDHTVVRVRGTYTGGFEASILRETEWGPQIWVAFDPGYAEKTDPGVFRAFRSLLHRGPDQRWTEQSAKVVFVGRFDGVMETQEWHGHTATIGFGHLGGYTCQLTVLAVEEAGWSPW